MQVKPTEFKGMKALVAPLDWGLGHATRCMPIIDALQNMGVEVHLGAAGRSLDLLSTEYPGHPIHQLPSCSIRYPEQGSMEWAMIHQMPQLLKTVIKDRKALGDLMAIHDFDLVISDNRYGFNSSRCQSVFITHQLNIQVSGKWKWTKRMIDKQNKNYINAFDELWIPDFAAPSNLSGLLSESPFELKVDPVFLGPISRMSNMNEAEDFENELLVILSGPEPQRSILETKILDQAQAFNGSCLIVRGVTESSETRRLNDNIVLVDHMSSDDLAKAIASSKMICSRSGYSSLMDYCASGKRAIIIPTPGQTEQEYLAERMKKMGWFYTETQEDFNLERAYESSFGYQPQLTSASSLEAILAKSLKKGREKKKALAV